MMSMIIIGIVIKVHLGHNQHKHYTAGSFLDRDKDLVMDVFCSELIIARLIKSSNERLQNKSEVHTIVLKPHQVRVEEEESLKAVIMRLLLGITAKHILGRNLS